MKDVVFYLLLTNMLVAIALGVRAGYWGSKLAIYIQKRHPEKGREFGCPKLGPGDGFNFCKALYKKHDIDDDPQFFRLKTKTRKATTWTVLALLPMSSFMILIVIRRLLFRT